MNLVTVKDIQRFIENFPRGTKRGRGGTGGFRSGGCGYGSTGHKCGRNETN